MKTARTKNKTKKKTTKKKKTQQEKANGREFDLWLVKIGADIVAVDSGQADAARRAWRRYGKRRHAASLNYGDCFSYALAMTRSEPLLFKGEGFAKTDVRSAPS